MGVPADIAPRANAPKLRPQACHGPLAVSQSLEKRGKLVGQVRFVTRPKSRTMGVTPQASAPSLSLRLR